MEIGLCKGQPNLVMRAFDLVSVKFCLCLGAGILLGYHFNISLPLTIIILVAFLSLLLVLKNRRQHKGFPLFGTIALLSVFFLGILVTTMAQPKNWPNHYKQLVTSKTGLWRVKITEVKKPTEFSERYVAQVISIDSIFASGRLMLNLSTKAATNVFKVDDEILFVGRPEALKPPLNPYQFDYRGYLKKQGIYHQIYLTEKQLIPLKKTRSTLLGRALNFREALIEKLASYPFGKEELGVMEALLLGKRDDISEQTYANYQKAGAVHILAVSGLHVGILLMLLQWMFQPLETLPYGKKLKGILIILLLWAFAVLAGLSPSIVRAVTMFSFLAYGLNLNRPTNPFNLIALSAFFILLIQPLFLFEIGFQMSYAAVIFIAWLYPKMQRFWYPNNWMLRKFWQLLSVSRTAQIGVLPLSLFYFHQFPALFFVSNLVVVPFLGLILAMGIVVVILAYASLLPSFLVSFYHAVIHLMNSIIAWVAQQERFVLKDIPFDGLQVFLTYFMLVTLVFYLTTKRAVSLALVLCGFIGLLFWGAYQERQFKSNESLILAHQTKNTVLLHQTGKQLNVLTRNYEATSRLVNDFMVGEKLTSIRQDSLKDSYRYLGKTIYIMDSLGIYPPINNLDCLVLTQSPKINLERLLDSLRPKMIVADGSNYKTYVNRWKTTCHKRKLPFHHTGEKGAFYFGSE